MADTIRERIITAFTTRAAPLSTLTIERARRSRNETNEKFVTVWDGEETSEPPEYNTQRLRFPIALECVWNASPDNPSVSCSAFLGSIISTMMGADHTFGGIAEKLQYQSATPTYPADGGDYVSLIVVFLITYSISAGDPYTAG